MFLKLFLTISVIINTEDAVNIRINQSRGAILTVEKYVWKNGIDTTKYCNNADAIIAEIRYLLLKNNSGSWNTDLSVLELNILNNW